MVQIMTLRITASKSVPNVNHQMFKFCFLPSQFIPLNFELIASCLLLMGIDRLKMLNNQKTEEEKAWKENSLI